MNGEKLNKFKQAVAERERLEKAEKAQREHDRNTLTEVEYQERMARTTLFRLVADITNGGKDGQGK